MCRLGILKSLIIGGIYHIFRFFKHGFTIVLSQRTHHRRNDRDSLRDALISFHAAQRQSAAQHGKASAAHKSKQQHQQHQQPNAADQIGDEAAFSMVSATISFQRTFIVSLICTIHAVSFRCHSR